MQVGFRNRRDVSEGKVWVRRHGGGSKGRRRRWAKAIEKAIETKNRQAARKECRQHEG